MYTPHTCALFPAGCTVLLCFVLREHVTSYLFGAILILLQSNLLPAFM